MLTSYNNYKMAKTLYKSTKMVDGMFIYFNNVNSINYSSLTVIYICLKKNLGKFGQTWANYTICKFCLINLFPFLALMQAWASHKANMSIINNTVFIFYTVFTSFFLYCLKFFSL